MLHIERTIKEDRPRPRETLGVSKGQAGLAFSNPEGYTNWRDTTLMVFDLVELNSFKSRNSTQ